MITGLILVQNNERTIAHVLDQLTTLTDEVVVVDGGSSDRTPEIAKAYNKVRFFERPFGNNFAAQRNYAIEQAKGDWILSVDSDELLGLQFKRYLRLWTRMPFVQYYRFPRYWLVDREGEICYCDSKAHYPDYQIRLFRNHERRRYHDKVHESFPKRYRRRGVKIPSAHIYHFCLLDSLDERRAKVTRYETIGRKIFRINDVYLWEQDDVQLRPLNNLSESMSSMIAAVSEQ